MTEYLKYKGYYATITVDTKNDQLYGKVAFINDLISFYGRTVEELREEFQRSVDDYLAFCEEVGDEPEKPFSGTFQVRIPADLHKKFAQDALERNESQNEYVKVSLENRLAGLEHNQVSHKHIHEVVSNPHLSFSVQFDPSEFGSQEWPSSTHTMHH